MLLALATLAAGAEPLLGPSGWMSLGPLPPGRDAARGEVVFDPATCAVEVGAVDLDGGPSHRDIRLARVWTEGAWAWADDWRVVEGRLVRPGRAPAPLDGLRFGNHVLRVDPAGRVTARVAAGRVVEILRDGGGAFEGMRAGTVDVRIDGDRGVASDGREVRWRRDAGLLQSVGDTAGTLVTYTYRGTALHRITWADGSALTVDPPGSRTGTGGVGGAWRCDATTTGRVTVNAPGGSWIVARTDDADTVTDPTGSTTRSVRRGGRLVGWTDPGGGETRLTRDARGRITEVTDPSGAAWGLTWSDAGLATLSGPDAATWTFARDSAGAVVGVTDPAGRAARWERDRGGAARSVGLGGGWWAVERDRAGRVVAIADPTGSRVQLVRDGTGAVTEVRDGSGGAWRLGRDGRGAVRAIADPAGAGWELARDSLGRVTSVTDPTGARTRWTLGTEGRPERVVAAGRYTWDLSWNAGGSLVGVRGPLGQTTRFTRDGVGRTRAVERADGTVLALDRDASGGLVGVGDTIRVRRDPAGRPLGIDAVGLVWDRDPAGRVVGVTGPGVSLAIAREPGGAVREVRIAGESPVRLTRDGQGNVVRADGALPVTLTRDAAGRITGLARDGAALGVSRDVRGLEARFTLDGKHWTVGRDAVGRVARLDAPEGVRLGVDRDAAGRPRLVRFPTGHLATFERDADAARVTVVDTDGRVTAEVDWALGGTGALGRIRAGVAWLLRRDPLGALAVAESPDAVWSVAPDGVEGPNGAVVRYGATGRPVVARPPAGEGGAWGLGEGEVRYELDANGAIVGVSGVVLAWDGVGRLVGWRGPGGDVTVRRDAFGRLVRVGRVAVEGWNGLLARDGLPRATVSDAGMAGPDGGVLVGPNGTLLATTRGGAVPWAPHGARAGGDLAAGGRFSAGPGLPAFGLLDAVDPVSGQPLGPTLRWPWEAPSVESTPFASPWPDPDASAVTPWDDAVWAAVSPWADPLGLLVAVGELPDGGPRSVRAPGVPWLPASAAPNLPAPVPDARALALDDDPLVLWVLAHARAPVRAPQAEELIAFFLGPVLEGQLDVPGGLAPPLPPELGG